MQVVSQFARRKELSYISGWLVAIHAMALSSSKHWVSHDVRHSCPHTQAPSEGFAEPYLTQRTLDQHFNHWVVGPSWVHVPKPRSASAYENDLRWAGTTPSATSKSLQRRSHLLNGWTKELSAQLRTQKVQVPTFEASGPKRH